MPGPDLGSGSKDEAAGAVGTFGFAVGAESEEHPRMTERATAAVTGDAGGFDADDFLGFHDASPNGVESADAPMIAMDERQS